MRKSKNQSVNVLTAEAHADSKDDGERVERSKYVYDLVNRWIENADNKVSVSCGIFTGVFGVITFLAEYYKSVPDNSAINECWRWLHKGSLIISLVVMAVAIILYAKAIVPNLKSCGTAIPTQKTYPIFYGDIHALRFKEYKDLMSKGTNGEFINELILESWYNSGICLRKMRWYKAGVISSLIAIAFSFLSLLSHFLMYR